jgi:magnesium chelatase family protein
MLDRIDIHARVPPVEVAALVRSGSGESSSSVRERVLRARVLQRDRAKALGLRATLNAALSSADLQRVVKLDRESERVIEGAVNHLGLSARAFNKVLRVARTSADLDGEPDVRATHIGEAILGRVLDQAAALDP